MARLLAPARHEGNADTIACASITTPTDDRPPTPLGLVTP
jgi:hypothetical protein